MKHLFLLIFLCAEINFLPAQTQKENYNSLLWRISGNGLKKDSYLFGTMHITDKRVFYFTDSLYYFLEKAEGFAAELDLTTVLNSYFSEFLNKDEDENSAGNKKLLIDSVDKKLIEKYKLKLERKLKKPINKITIKEIEKYKDGWMDEFIRNGEMRTLMDAYLFDLAEKQGKWVGGIEDPEDQFNLEEQQTLEDKLKLLTSEFYSEKQQIEWMIRTYINQDLQAIDLSERIWQGSKDQILIQRNYKMARRIDSLSAIRSTLFAVGAAHIPGDEGLVSLLRKKGFSVTPVYSAKTIAPEKYAYTKIEKPWIKIPVKDSMYTIYAPGTSVLFDMKEDLPIEMRYYFDVANMRAFFTMNIILPDAIEEKDKVGIYDKFLDRFGSGEKKKSSIKDIIINGTKGIEAVTSEDGSDVRLQMFIPGSFLVLNMISGLKRDALFDTDAEKFYKSFLVNKQPGMVQTDVKKEWQKREYRQHGFSVESPSALTLKKPDTSNPVWNAIQFQTYDIKEEVFFGLIVSTVTKGYYSNSDSAYFEQASEELNANLKGELVSKEHSSFDGYPACRALYVKSEKNEEVDFNLYMVNKGPRRYILFTTSLSGKAQSDISVRRYFDSFRFVETNNPVWKFQTSSDHNFSTWSPAEIKRDDNLEKRSNEIKYLIYDSVSLLQVSIDKEVIAPFLWADSDSSFLADKARTFFDENDSVIYNRVFSNNKITGRDLLLKMPDTHNHKRVRVFLQGDTIYSIYTYLPFPLLETENLKRLFNDFSFSYATREGRLTKPAPALLLEALKTKDSLQFEIATEALNYVTFQKEDLPLLQEALLYRYYDFDSSYYNNTNRTITDLAASLDSNHLNLQFIRENYTKLNNNNEYLKPYLLQLLSSDKTGESYNVLKDLLVKWPPQIMHSYYFTNSFYDSLALSARLFPELLTLADDPGSSDWITMLALRLLDSTLLSKNQIRQYKNKFLSNTERLSVLSPEKRSENTFEFSNLIKMLGKIELPETSAKLFKLAKQDNERSIRLDIILALAESNQLPDQKEIYTLATTDEFRGELYNKLKKLGKEKLFPKDFLTQRHLGQSEVYAYAAEEGEPDLIEFIGERTEHFMGKKQKFYLYKVLFMGDENFNYFLGVAGPFSLDPKDLQSSHDVTGLYWSEYFDEKRKDDHLKELIKQAEEWLQSKDK